MAIVKIIGNVYWIYTMCQVLLQVFNCVSQENFIITSELMFPHSLLHAAMLQVNAQERISWSIKKLHFYILKHGMYADIHWFLLKMAYALCMLYLCRHCGGRETLLTFPLLTHKGFPNKKYPVILISCYWVWLAGAVYFAMINNLKLVLSPAVITTN